MTDRDVTGHGGPQRRHCHLRIHRDTLYFEHKYKAVCGAMNCTRAQQVRAAGKAAAVMEPLVLGLVLVNLLFVFPLESVNIPLNHGAK